MMLRRIIGLTVLSAAMAVQPHRVRAQCIYAVSNPAGSFRQVVSISREDGSGSIALDVPEGLPSAILSARDGSEAYVGVTQSAAGCPESSSIIAFPSGGEPRSLRLSKPGSFGAMAIHPDGTRLYAVDNLVGKLFIVTTSTLTVSKVVSMPNAVGFCPEGADLGGPGFVAMAVSPDGRWLLITTGWCGDICYESLSVIDTDTESISGELDASFTRIAFAPDSLRAYVQNGAVIGISLFDLESAASVAEFPVEVNGLATAPDGVFALTSSNVLVLDPQTNTVTRQIDPGGRFLASDLGADRLYVATSDRTEVVVLKASTGKELDRVALENPVWIAAGPCPGAEVGRGGDDGCQIRYSRPTWLAAALIVTSLGLLAGRRRRNL
jgi:DNA-binding beta-propeller fold protein YncE